MEQQNDPAPSPTPSPAPLGDRERAELQLSEGHIADVLQGIRVALASRLLHIRFDTAPSWITFWRHPVLTEPDHPSAHLCRRHLQTHPTTAKPHALPMLNMAVAQVDRWDVDQGIVTGDLPQLTCVGCLRQMIREQVWLLYPNGELHTRQGLYRITIAQRGRHGDDDEAMLPEDLDMSWVASASGPLWF